MERKVQAMSPVHHKRRVQFSRWALREYWIAVTGNTVWVCLVNTDSLAMIKKNGKLYVKNHIIWSRSSSNLLKFQQEKFDNSFMVWGGISLRGLLPAQALIFVADLKEEWRRLGHQLGRGVQWPDVCPLFT